MWLFFQPACQKGIGLILLNQNVDVKWQHKPSRVQQQEPQQEFSFLVNKHTNPGIGLPGDGVGGLAKAVTFGLLWSALDAP